MSYERLREAVLFKKYRPRKNEWRICDDEGYSLAHLYATKAPPPEDMDILLMADHSGLTVIQVAASHGNLHCVKDKRDLEKMGLSPELVTAVWEAHLSYVRECLKTK